MRHLLTLVFLVFCALCLIGNYMTAATIRKNLFFFNGQLQGEMTRTHMPRHPFIPRRQMCDNEVPPLLYELENSQPPRPLKEINFDWAGADPDQDEVQQMVKRTRSYLQMSPMEANKELLNVELYPPSCACQTKYELVDLGYNNFPRYLLNAVCVNRGTTSVKCWRGSRCREIPYKVRVLAERDENEKVHEDELASMLPENLRYSWKFKTVQISAACQCAL